MKIGIVDYGVGNISSILSALHYIGYSDITVSSDIKQLSHMDKFLLPGVGNFAKAMQSIEELNLKTFLIQTVLEEKRPLLGVCVGMQLLAKSSEESGFNLGLGLISGQLKKFQNDKFSIPHVGFNQVTPCEGSRLYREINPTPDFYFAHSYRLQSTSDIGQSTCHYSEHFIASFEQDNIAGVQFHPELSQTNGLQLLKNFLQLF